MDQNSAAGAKKPRKDVKNHFASNLDAILTTTQIGLWDWDLATGEVLYSPEWERIAGYDEGELDQNVSSWEHALFPEDLAHAERQIQRHLDGKTPYYEAEFRMVRKDGSLIWAQDKGLVTEWDADGKPRRLIGVLQDISSIKATQAALKEKSEQLDFVAAMSGLAMWDWDLVTDTISYDQRYLDMIGMKPDEVTGSYEEWAGLNHPDDLDQVNQALEDYLAGKTDFYRQETRMLKKDGSYVWTLDTGRIVGWDENGKPTRLLGGHLDIDELKRTGLELQHALQENRHYAAQLQAEVDKVAQNLTDIQAFNQAMFDASPYASVLFDDKLTILDCNQEAVEYFKFKDKDDLRANLMKLMAESIPDKQPDGRPSRSPADIFKAVLERGTIDFETELLLHGRRTPLRGVFKKIIRGGTYTIAAYVMDLASLKEAKNELLRQDFLLQRINRVATRLNQTDPSAFDMAIWKSLKDLGESTEVERMYIWENFTGEDGKLYCRQIYEWSEGAEPQQGKDFAEASCYEDMTLWYATLSKGDSLNGPVRDFPAFERETLESQGIKSVLILPLTVRGEFWGFVGFDDCQSERSFSPGEEKILRSGGSLLVSAILRNQATQNLIEAREAALASDKAKSDFLSRMSHEIRTPMNAIIGMTTIAKKMRDFSKIQYSLDKIDAASQQLLDIINDILDMSKIESGKFELSANEFNFEKMMQNVFNVIQVQVEEKQQTLSFDFDGMLTRNMIGDELRLNQVMINLLSNAVKFTPIKGEISLKVRYSQAGDNPDAAVLHVEVKDNGIGVSPQQQEKLFQRFEQADGGITRRYGGTGLGLAICKNIVQMMDGDIWVESEEGKGSTFIFEVKVGWGGEVRDDLPAQSLRGDLRILVVDDSEDVRVYFTNILASFALKCDLAASGGEAVEMVRTAWEAGKPYDLIFLDWKMPGMSGADTAGQIIDVTGSGDAIVMISAGDLSELEGELRGEGVSNFLPKPVLPSVLYNTVVRLTDNNLMVPPAQDDFSRFHWQTKQLLLVEDVEINREIILGILDETGVKIDCAFNGLEAVAQFTQNPEKYDMILMDVQMPEMDGLEATRQIRESGKPGAGTIPIYAMTANAFKKDVEDCLAAGMNGHISKPIDVDVLIKVLAEHLGQG